MVFVAVAKYEVIDFVAMANERLEPMQSTKPDFCLPHALRLVFRSYMLGHGHEPKAVVTCKESHGLRLPSARYSCGKILFLKR
jgi:hypothetical protein